jgi:outer membrane lipoprotein-sorting protein
MLASKAFVPARRGVARLRKRVTHLPSELRRAVAVLCFCALAGGTVSGCGLLKPAPTLLPPTTKYAASAKLASNLDSLGDLSGPIQGTIKIGDETRKLSGSVAIKGKDSQISLVDDTDQTLADEIVVGGRRYTSPDDKLWIHRGVKPAGTSLAAALAAADTTHDAGPKTVESVTAHQILTPADVVDVAPALGIDTWTFDNESTTLRVWADAAGKPLGFGATMSWQVTLGGQQQAVTVDLDVMFSYTSPVEIKAPDAPWDWTEDRTGGISVGLPDGWRLDTVSTTGATTLSDKATKSAMTYKHFDPLGKSLDEVSQDAIGGFDSAPSGPENYSLDGEPAHRYRYDDSKTSTYQVVSVVIHETVGWVFTVSGPKANKSAVDDIATQMMSTIEFTR